ncbi:hypothetical protein HYH02_007819 [Chlamydomonas schloesseri]|uniref:SBP-type domain-containing protein n=1 Tax=Chlamydomonas schloesseri TaxID=2026947 RepID=A0A836B4D5_9CHLO|nr:hypothetical protein HYH02_007819 [Chlamydomonas schloesseri]|eukprot:KAG2447068.1 hypothetical protein HYH02_007819 [Chlamydomonas schloesseri]
MSLPPDPEGCGAGAFIYRDTSARGLYAGLAPHFNDRRLSDICILRPDGKTVYAHQVVLAACSRKFSSVFGQGEATGKELPIQGVDSAALELVISSFYHGECRLTPTTVVPVYDVCLKLEVPGLTTACEQYLQRSMSADTCCIYLEAALGVLLEHTVKSCLTYAKGRFEEVAASPSFLSLSTKTVRLLLTQVRNSGSGITDISLARALARWAVTKPEHLSECESIFKELNVTTTALLQLLQSAEFVHALQSKPGVAAAGGAGVGGVGGGGSVAGAGNQQQQHPLPSPHHQQPPQAAAAAAGDATPASQQQQQGGAGPWRDGRETFGSVREASSREGGAVSSGLPALGGIGNGRTGGPNGSPAQNASSQQAPGGPAGATAGPPHGGPPQQPRSSPLLASSGAGKTGERGPHGDYGGDGPGARPASAAGAQYGTGSGGSGRGPSSQQAAPQQGSRPGSGRSPPPPFGRQSQPEHLAGAGGSSGLAVGGSDGPFQRRSLPPELLSGTADDDRQQAYARRYGTIAGGSPALRSLLGPGRGGGNDRAAPDSEIAAAAARGAGGGGGDGGGERDNLVALPLPMLELAGLTVQLTPSGTLAATGGPLGSKQVPLSVSSGSGRSGPLMVLLPAGVVRRLQQASSGPVAFESGGGGGSGRSGAVGSGGRPDDGSPPLPPGLLQPQQQHQQRDPGTDRPDRYGGPGVSPHAAAPLGRGSAGLGPFQRSSLDMLSSVAASAEEQAGFVDVPGLPRIGPAGARPASASGLAAGPRSASLGAGALGLSGGRSGRQVDLGGLGSLAQHMVSDSGGVPGRWSVPGIGPGAGGSTLLSLGGSLSGPGDLLSADAGSLNGGGGPLLGGISKRRRPSPEDFDPDHEEPGLGLGGAGGGGGRGGGGGLTPPAAGGGGGGRGRGGGGYSSKGPLLCHVDDCNVDLSSLKEYHQRFRICDFHLKAEVVLREGIPQRFCQQCGRFHLLSEFDGTKRSCRARLQRHNARRRKRPDQKGDGDDVPRRRPVYQTMPQHVSAGVVAGNMALAAAAAAAGMPGPHAGGGGGAGSSSMHIPGLPTSSGAAVW